MAIRSNKYSKSIAKFIPENSFVIHNNRNNFCSAPENVKARTEVKFLLYDFLTPITAFGTRSLNMGLLLRGEYHVFGATVVSSLFQTKEVMYVTNLKSSYYRTPTPIGCSTKEMHIPPTSNGLS